MSKDEEPEVVEAEEVVTLSPVEAAVAAMQTGYAAAQISAPGEPPPDLPTVIFERLSVERRLLGCVNDDFYSTRLGSRNNLASISDWALNDPGTVGAPAPNHRLEVAGLTLAEAVQKVLDCLERLVGAGLLERDGDLNDPSHTYHVTEAGIVELSS